MIRQQYDIDRIIQSCLKLRKTCPIVRFDHIVRVQPQDKILRGLCKRKIARGSKIIAPCEIHNPAILRRDLPRAVCRTSIGHNDLID